MGDQLVITSRNGPLFGFLMQPTAISFPSRAPTPPATGWTISLALQVNVVGPKGAYDYGSKVYAWLAAGPYFSPVTLLPTERDPSGTGYFPVGSVTLKISNPALSPGVAPTFQLFLAEDINDAAGGGFLTYGADFSSIPYGGTSTQLPTLGAVQLGEYDQDVLVAGQVTFVNALGQVFTSALPKAPPYTLSMSGTVTKDPVTGNYSKTALLANNGICVGTAVVLFDAFGNPTLVENTVTDFPPTPPVGASNYFAAVFSGGINNDINGNLTTAFFGGQNGGISTNGLNMTDWFSWLLASQLPPDLPPG